MASNIHANLRRPLQQPPGDRTAAPASGAFHFNSGFNSEAHTSPGRDAGVGAQQAAAAGARAQPRPTPAARLPGQALRRCFSSSDSSSRNSNQHVCGGVQGRLEVAASRSAASALILPPPPLLPPPPGSNLTLAGACVRPNRPERPDRSHRPRWRSSLPPACPRIRSSPRSRPIAVRVGSEGAGPTGRPASWLPRSRQVPLELDSGGAFRVPWEFLTEKMKRLRCLRRQTSETRSSCFVSGALPFWIPSHLPPLPVSQMQIADS